MLLTQGKGKTGEVRNDENIADYAAPATGRSMGSRWRRAPSGARA